MQSLIEQSYERDDTKIQIRRCYTCGEVNSTKSLLVTFRHFSYTNKSWKL